jgi:hypothetical protein
MARQLHDICDNATMQEDMDVKQTLEAFMPMAHDIVVSPLTRPGKALSDPVLPSGACRQQLWKVRWVGRWVRGWVVGGRVAGGWRAWRRWRLKFDGAGRGLGRARFF